MPAPPGVGVHRPLGVEHADVALVTMQSVVPAPAPFWMLRPGTRSTPVGSCVKKSVGFHLAPLTRTSFQALLQDTLTSHSILSSLSVIVLQHALLSMQPAQVIV